MWKRCATLRFEKLEKINQVEIDFSCISFSRSSLASAIGTYSKISAKGGRERKFEWLNSNMIWMMICKQENKKCKFSWINFSISAHAFAGLRQRLHKDLSKSQRWEEGYDDDELREQRWKKTNSSEIRDDALPMTLNQMPKYFAIQDCESAQSTEERSTRWLWNASTWLQAESESRL